MHGENVNKDGVIYMECGVNEQNGINYHRLGVNVQLLPLVVVATIKKSLKLTENKSNINTNIFIIE